MSGRRSTSGLSECRCTEDGGTSCYERALAAVEGDERATQAVELVNRTRLAQGLTFHVTDTAALHKVADLLRPQEP